MLTIDRIERVPKLSRNVLYGAVHSGKRRILELPQEREHDRRSSWAIGWPLLIAFAFIAYYLAPLGRMIP